MEVELVKLFIMWQARCLCLMLHLLSMCMCVFVSQAVYQSGGTACLWLGQLAERGLGLPAGAPDYVEAAAWYGKGAALGHLACAQALAFYYQHGLGECGSSANKVISAVLACGQALTHNTVTHCLPTGQGSKKFTSFTARP